MTTDLPMSKHHMRESSSLVTLRILSTFCITTFIFLSFLIIFLTNNPFENILFTIFSIFGVYFFLSLVTSIITIFFVLSRLSTDYYLSEHTLVTHTGLIHVEENIYELKNVYAVRRSQSWLGRIFRYGNLIVNIAAANYQKEVRLIGIQKPKKYEKILEEFISKQKTSLTENSDTTK